jgi:hypothetical protein
MRRLLRSLAIVTIGVVVAGFATVAPGGPRSLDRFEPVRLADLELRMWQAYYAKQNTRLFGLLTTMLREQYHYSWATASREAFHLARAATTFGNLRSEYEQVLPDLEAGYTTARNWLDAKFDPHAVARAELAWWVARRVPGSNSAEQIGGLIADEYAILYDVPCSAVLPAARLRAQAAALRDAEAAAPDWTTIGRMLNDSYLSLHDAVSRRPAGVARGPEDRPRTAVHLTDTSAAQ